MYYLIVNLFELHQSQFNYLIAVDFNWIGCNSVNSIIYYWINRSISRGRLRNGPSSCRRHRQDRLQRPQPGAQKRGGATQLLPLLLPLLLLPPVGRGGQRRRRRQRHQRPRGELAPMAGGAAHDASDAAAFRRRRFSLRAGVAGRPSTLPLLRCQFSIFSNDAG